MQPIILSTAEALEREYEWPMLRKLRVGAIAIGLAFLYYVLFQAFYNMEVYNTPYPYDSLSVMAGAVCRNFTGIFIAALYNYFIVFWLPAMRTISRKMVRDVCLSYAVMAATNLLYSLFGVVVDWAGTIFNNTILLLGMLTAYYVMHFRSEVTRSEQRKRRETEFRYQALKAHINPHFLFNSLNILHSLIEIDPEKAQDFSVAIAELYRYILANQEKPSVPLDSELDFLNRYCDVLKMRYPKGFDIEVSGTEHSAHHTLIPFTLQLLIENVTKHNVISTAHPMRVEVQLHDQYLAVSNPIQPKATGQSSAFGLRYLHELYNNHDREFTVINDGSTFTAIVSYLS